MSRTKQESQIWIEAHNAKATAVWEAFHAGRPARPPVALGTNTRFFIANEDLNPGERVTFEYYSTDGVTMLQFQLRAAEWRAANSGTVNGGRFLLREGNNLAPGTPGANLEAMYETARAWSPPGLSS